ncbi:hypothetical protein TNCV_4799041 [Trichonephila clavipes]|nr:hypothetical protein TNCV_4799041 [Trichonephila clavipes]
MGLFLTLFERQMKLLDLGEDLWVPYLIGALPSDVTSLIACWLNELKIDSFDGLKNLMIANQMKKRGSPQCAPPATSTSHKRTNVATNHINAYTAQTRSPRLTLIDITFCGIKGRVCADTGSSHLIAGERMFQIFKDKGTPFPGNHISNELSRWSTDHRMSPVKNCRDCIKYKASDQKPSGLLQTPVPAQRFETLAIDLFGPLPESKDSKRWILIIDDCTTKWVELFALPNAIAKECAITLIEEVLLRYGIPRRLISDNGTQFVSAVMQQICYLLNIHQSLISVYHPQANPVERRNRDLKPRLAILVQDKHDCWSEKLPFIRFALNTTKCEMTGQTAAFLNFGRELRTPSEVVNDIRVVIQNNNFVPEITPYLKKFAKFSTHIREVVEEQQDSRKFYADKKRKAAPTY